MRTPKLPATVTVKWLLELGACPRSVASFRRIFPDGMPVTAENIFRAHARKLDVKFVVRRVLTDREFDRLCKACQKKRKIHGEKTDASYMAVSELIAAAWHKKAAKRKAVPHD